MRKFLLLIFGALVALPALSQVKPKGGLPSYFIGEVTRIWYPKRIPVTDGYSYRYFVHAKFDTAMVHITGTDTFEVTVSFKKYSPTVPTPPLPDIIASIDDNVAGTGQKYYPEINAGDNIYITNGWSHMKNQQWNVNHYEKTFSFVELAGAYIELTCSPCYKIEWYSEKRENHGIASIQIDNGEPVDVDLYEARTDNNSIRVYTTPTMINATHKLRVYFTGRKNPASTQTNIGHDRFVTHRKQ